MGSFSIDTNYKQVVYNIRNLMITRERNCAVRRMNSHNAFCHVIPVA